MFEDTEFASRSYSVPSGCRILLCSDGAIEIPLADNRHLTLPEFTRLNARLAGSPDWSPDDLIEELRALSPQGRLDDDCSLIQMTFD
jgi:serine phosphatase RsbU (regulator of sigma subunit)